MSGTVQTVLTSGIRANAVQITAAVDVTGDTFFDILTQCTLVTIVGAPPVQGSLSLRPAFANVAGRVTSGLEDALTVFMADRFGNPVPPNTAVSFTTNAGLVTGQGLANDQGEATSILQTQAPITPEGLVIAMAHTRGQEPFIDNNGNGIFDLGIDLIANNSVPEPFIDRNGNCRFDPGDPNEIFIDVNGNGMWDPAQGDSLEWDDDIFVWDTTPVIFSGGTAVADVCTIADSLISVPADADCGAGTSSSFTIANGGSARLQIIAKDGFDGSSSLLGNPLVGGTTITVATTAGTVAPASFTVPDATNCTGTSCGGNPTSFPAAACGTIADGLTRFFVTISDSDAADDPADPLESATVTVTITSDISGTAPGGNSSVTFAIGGTID
jgi:hypothetical protein